METLCVVSAFSRFTKLTLSCLFAIIMLAMVGLISANQREALLVEDINPLGDSMPDIRFVYFTVITDTLYFVASDPDHGPELWKSDGTEAGTALVKDIRPGFDSLTPGDLVNFHGTLFFRANDGVTGEELWTSDGTLSGTVLFKDINPAGSAFPFRFQAVNDLLFFSADDGAHGQELWKSDGTVTGTVMVRDVATGTVASGPTILTNVDGTLFFIADDSVNGVELWRSDGSVSGTVMVKDINSGGSSNPRGLINVGGTLFFTADDGVSGRELWKSDGTEVGTTRVADISPDPSESGPFALTNVGGTLFFRANDGIHGLELWKSDGTALGTEMVKDIVSGSFGSQPRDLTNVAGTLYFGANDGVNGVELWKSDGTLTGTVLVEDINPGLSPSLFGQLASIDDTLFFPADDGVNGLELWRSNGEAWNTFLVAEIDEDGSSQPASLKKLGTGLVFVADDGVSGRELWYVDLTNQLPTADAAGPYVGDEGSVIPLNGNVGDADGDDVVLDWSADSPLCAFSDQTVHNPELICDDDGVYTVTLTATDVWTGVATDTVQVTISNVSPTIDSLVPPNEPVLVDTIVAITATYSDPGAADTHTFEIDWGDGEIVAGAAAGGTLAADHQYASAGTYTITAIVTDDDGDVGSAAANVVVIAGYRTLLPVILKR